MQDQFGTTQSDLLTTSQVARLFGVSHDTIVAWRRKRIGPAFIVVGRRTIRYALTAVDAFLANRTVDVNAALDGADADKSAAGQGS